MGQDPHGVAQLHELHRRFLEKGEEGAGFVLAADAAIGLIIGLQDLVALDARQFDGVFHRRATLAGKLCVPTFNLGARQGRVDLDQGAGGVSAQIGPNPFVIDKALPGEHGLLEGLFLQLHRRLNPVEAPIVLAAHQPHGQGAHRLDRRAGAQGDSGEAGHLAGGEILHRQKVFGFQLKKGVVRLDPAPCQPFAHQEGIKARQLVDQLQGGDVARLRDRIQQGSLLQKTQPVPLPDIDRPRAEFQIVRVDGNHNLGGQSARICKHFPLFRFWRDLCQYSFLQVFI